MNILIVEDNVVLAELLSKYFKLQKYTCHAVSDGRMALSMMQTKIYDIVFLDLAMPETTGYDVIESLRNSDSIKNQKIIVLTAVYLTKLDIEALLKQGVYEVLQKPIPLHGLMDYVRLNIPKS